MFVEIATIFEDIGHARAEHARAFARSLGFCIPANGLAPMCIREEASRGLGSPELLPNTLCPRVRVAMLASLRDLHAAPPGVKRVSGPFDFRVFAHRSRATPRVMHVFDLLVNPL